MNLSNLKSDWNQFKVMNGLSDISEAEILSAIEPQKSGTGKVLADRIIQNVFAYSLLLLALNGCAI
ncbi:hypothetical protein [Algoriphagus sp. A40]|uniref:hypothetical protein n=1 Tax=Algoriphagus sp. A40 TaxID=1945863 RepID=UPI0009861011|nr:hypothetical protein [Algoriphagus sp. A40]OOG76191.1 hypothetical protein B0E43_09120 [Algoriphagus sp. A40]